MRVTRGVILLPALSSNARRSYIATFTRSSNAGPHPCPMTRSPQAKPTTRPPHPHLHCACPTLVDK
ncbi:unnamed protein product [Ectocarpus sp. CCAP 1310/34]|nr:unnamed protein product [Ectocarpus sp. CCAP 1310/34]